MNLKKPGPETLRLNKYLTKRGQISRRQADQLIKKGKVFVNGKKISHLAVFVDPKKDSVRIQGRQISQQKAPPLYLMFNKPPKVLSAQQDSKGRPVVTDYIRKKKARLFLVGRLDWDSEGLLLLTNDGDFADKVLHPRHKIPKTYFVKLRGQPKDSQLKRLIKGVSTPVGKSRALFVKKLSKKSSSNTWIKIIIAEGKKRQIRLMFEKIGFPVNQLKRTAIGCLRLNKLKKGTFLYLSEKDVEKVFKIPKELKKDFSKKKKPS